MTRGYEGPWDFMVQWWTAHLEKEALVVVKCAHGEPRCGKRIAEIKRDGEQTMVCRRVVRLEPTVRRPEWADAAPEREQHVLRRFDTEDGPMEVMKQRRDLPDAVGPLEMFTKYSCPEHGEIPVDPADVADFVAQVDDTLSLTQRTYWAPRCPD
jgi:hypothetical protein